MHNLNAYEQRIIILSAKNRNRLKVQGEQLLQIIHTKKISENQLDSLAYTLQVGRDAMEERMGLLVNSLEDLEYKLSNYIQGNSVTSLYEGNIKQAKDAIDLFEKDEDLNRTISLWISKGKYNRLIELWVKGLDIDWTILYDDKKPKKISLPTYPFEQQHYWLRDKQISYKVQNLFDKHEVTPQKRHSLLHENTSNLKVQQYTSVFTGDEKFFVDHVIAHKKILPASAYLEMIRESLVQSLGENQVGTPQIIIKDIVWRKAIIIEEQPQIIKVELYPQDNQWINIKIFNESTNKVLCCEANATYTQDIEGSSYQVEQIKQQCCQAYMSGADYYDVLRKQGFEYGNSHRGIETLHIASNKVLATLELPEEVITTLEEYVLHPSIIDMALQAAGGFYGLDHNLELGVPFKLEQFILLSPSKKLKYVVVQRKITKNKTKYDIDLCDEQGNICIQLKGFETNKLGLLEENNLSMYKKVWQETDLQSNGDIPYDQWFVLGCGLERETFDDIKIQSRGANCINILSDRSDLAERFTEQMLLIFNKVKQILSEKIDAKYLIQIVVNQNESNFLVNGINALVGTIRQEYPTVVAQCIEIDHSSDITQILNVNKKDYLHTQVKSKENKCYMQQYEKIQSTSKFTKEVWQNNGVYIITGGNGSLGRLFAKEIIEKSSQSTVILLGRRDLTSQEQSMIDTLNKQEERVFYRKVNLLDNTQLTRLIQSIKAEFGAIKGIIHSAGVIQDQYMLSKTEESFKNVLAPKVHGLENIDLATKDEALDFFVTFSSLASIFGNAGQVDYAIANAFMDYYMEYRQNLVENGERKGYSLSINWPLWQEGTMGNQPKTIDFLKKKFDMSPMITSLGMDLFYQALFSDSHQVIIMNHPIDIQSPIKIQETPVNTTIAHETTQINDELLYEKSMTYFKKIFSELTQVPIQDIDDDEELEVLGMDSFMINELTSRLEESFGQISAVLFYKYHTINALVNYFIQDYTQQLKQLIGITQVELSQPQQEENIVVPIQQPKETPSINSKSFRTFINTQNLEVEDKQGLQIAIIGMAGRYPQAQNIEQLWEVLTNGIDCITEIPNDRWQHDSFYTPHKNVEGKTYSKWGGFIEGVDEFDPLFFHISPKEVEKMDPEERLFLQCAYEAIEDAGYTKDTLSPNESFSDSVGVFVGAMLQEYLLYGAQETLNGNPMAVGGTSASIANRVSYFCNFHGPSLTVNTLCSSSLMSIHLACHSLKLGECKVAIAGGVNLSLHPNKYLLLARDNFLSTNGHCNSFGANGDGYVPAEGVGALILKPLAQAIADNDHIYGVIQGSAVNHDGKTNGYTVPNPVAQSDVIRRALKEAHIRPRAVSYIEAHGTGTALGDPIEITGLSDVFEPDTNEKQFCAIGSIKSNFGHCEGAAGIAGVTKVLLQMKHQLLVPSLHAQTMNPHLTLEETPFKLQQSLEEWQPPIITEDNNQMVCSRVAGISSFGAGGANAHIVIEEYVPNKVETNYIPGMPVIIILSAKEKSQLSLQAQNLLAHLEKHNYIDKDLINIAYTLQIGREHFRDRLAMVVDSIETLKEKLDHFIAQGDNADDIMVGHLVSGNTEISSLINNEEMKQLIDDWIAKNEYAKVAHAWVKGISIHWQDLYINLNPYRISLPTYSFKKTKYWLNDHPFEVGIRNRQNMLSSNMDILEDTDYMYLPTWEEAANHYRLENKEHILIVASEDMKQLQSHIAQYYKETLNNNHIVQLTISDKTKAISETELFVNKANQTDLEEIVRKYAQQINVIYFIGEHGKANLVNLETLKSSSLSNERMLLRLIKTIKAINSTNKEIDLYIISQDTYKVDAISPLGGGLVGMGYAIAQAESTFKVRNLQISLNCVQNMNVLIDAIVNEPPSLIGEAILLQQNRRYKQTFVPISQDSIQTTSALKKEGTYVIVGGSGTVGRVISKYLISQYNANVIWIGRKDAHNDQISRLLNEYEPLAKKPVYIQADITSMESMQHALEEIKASHKEINGVIFSALIFNPNNSISKTTESEFFNIYNVKMLGSIHCYEVFKDEPLDFMCYFSSAQTFAFSSAVNFSAYASGITFEDAFVRYIGRKAKFPVGTINWGFWEASISEKESRLKNVSALSNKVGVKGFETFLALMHQNQLKQVVCMNMSTSLKEKICTKNKQFKALASNNDISVDHLVMATHDYEEKISCILPEEEALVKVLNEHIVKVLLVQLQSIGLFYEKHTFDELCSQFNILPKYTRWLKECLYILKQADYIKEDNNYFMINPVYAFMDFEETWQEWNQLKAKYLAIPDKVAQINLIDATLQNLPQIIQGHIRATDIMFPNASMSLVEGIYKGNTLADAYNDVIAEVVKDYITQELQKDENAKIRIIEAGAGTGGTSTRVFNKIKQFKDHISYTYTDLSKSFLLYGKEQYGKDNPYLEYKLWNIEQPVEGQSIESGTYDILIATNVIHATQDIHCTLANLKAALKKNGIILINELVNKAIFTTLTFGLLDGWWLYRDEAIRTPGSPMLSIESWKDVLSNNQFEDIQFVPSSAILSEQKVILARSNGVIECAKKLPKESKLLDQQEDMLKAKDYQSVTKHRGNVSHSKEDVPNELNIEEYVENTLIECLANSLKMPIESVETGISFFDYGVDSIISISLINSINNVLGTAMDSTTLFDYTSIQKLKNYILKEYKEHLSNHFMQQEDTNLVSNQEIDNLDELQEMFAKGSLSVDQLISIIEGDDEQNG